jgi:hypothetical protein
VATILADTLAQLAAAGVVLVEGDMDDVAALDAAAGFPIALYEFVTDFNRYHAGHATGLDFAGVAAQVKSPAVKRARRRRSGIVNDWSRVRVAAPAAAGAGPMTRNINALRQRSCATPMYNWRANWFL